MNLGKIKYLFLLLIMGLTFSQCKKDELPDITESNGPVFNVEGTLGNQKISLHAGEKNAFMHTSIGELNNVPQYSGKLSNGSTSFKVQVFPSNIDIPSFSNKFNEQEVYTLAEPIQSQNLLSLSIDNFPYYDLINTIEWKVDGIQQSNSTLEINAPGKYLVCANIHFTNGEVESTCNTIIVGYKLHANYQLEYTIDPDSILEASIMAPTNQISKISWYVNNEFQSNAIHFQSGSLPNKFHLKAKVEFKNGVVGTREIFVNKSNPGTSIPDFTSLGQKSSITWDNSVLITLIDNGQTYIAKNDLSTPVHFVVNSIASYASNSNGDKVKLIKGSLTAPFMNIDTGSSQSGDFKIDIGVAY